MKKAFAYLLESGISKRGSNSKRCSSYLGVRVLKFAEDLLVYSGNLIVDSLIQFMLMIYVTAYTGFLTLYIFIQPEGLPGIIARYLLEYSRSTGQNDFPTIYAVFSTAVVMLILMIISIVIITNSAFKHEMPDDEAKPE